MDQRCERCEKKYPGPVVLDGVEYWLCDECKYRVMLNRFTMDKDYIEGA